MRMIQRFCRRWRLSVVACVGALLMVQGSGQSASTANTGIDPLEVLKLEIKPNVMVVMDTSGSMAFSLDSAPGFRRTAVGSDDPMSRMYMAKQALAQVVRETKDKVNFGVGAFRNENSRRHVTSPQWDGDGTDDNDGLLNSGTDGGKEDGPLMYVSVDPKAARWFADSDDDGILETSDRVDCRTDATTTTGNTIEGGSPRTNLTFGWFCDIRNTTSAWNDALATATASPSNQQSSETFRSFGNRGVHAFPIPETSSNVKYGTADLQVDSAASPTAITANSWLSGLALEQCIEGTPPNSSGVASTPDNNATACRFHMPLQPTGCAPGEPCRFRYYLQSRFLRHGVRYVWNRNELDPGKKLIKVESFTCPNAPGGLLGWEPDPDEDGDYAEHYVSGKISESRPCFAFAEGDPTTGVVDTTTQSVFYYTSAFFEGGVGCGNEDSLLTLETVTPCGDATRVENNGESILKATRPAGGQIDGSGTNPVVPALTLNPLPDIPSLTNSSSPTNPTTTTGTSVDDILGPTGLRAGGGTPLGATLRQIASGTVTVFPTPASPRQKNYVLVLTDGQDNCMGPGSTSCCPADYTSATPGTDPLCQCGFGGASENDASFYVAQQAQVLWWNQNDPDGTSGAQTAPAPQRGAELLFVAFTGGANAVYADRIAHAGSGGKVNVTSTTSPISGTVDCTGVTCRDAFIAKSQDQLVQALRDALKYATSADEFSAQQVGTVVETIYEFGGAIDTDPSPTSARYADPLDPDARYTSTFPLVFQATFNMPGFEGKVKAFKQGTTTPVWEAGQKLMNRINGGLDGSSGMSSGTGRHTFAELVGGAPAADQYSLKPAAAAKIQRRIFTTARNGVAPTNIPLWPPTRTGTGAVAPTTTDPGRFDAQLGLVGPTFAELQAEFKACQGTITTAHPCLDPTLQLAQARKEAREIILAFTAGAQLATDASGPARDAAGELLYEARRWVLAESTLSTPAVIGPPPQIDTAAHRNEWAIYRDGYRNATNRVNTTPHPLEEGVGLRRPDRLDPTATSDPDIKPVMTVVYIGTNHLLHAFRAGPQRCSSPGTCPDPTSGFEGGGEELWAFCPYELLPNLRKLMQSQGTTLDTHTFMIESSIRFGDVFFPGTYTDPLGVTRDGRWRNVMVFGRGAGGKHLTAMDISERGPFTRHSLDTRLPKVLWNRGNPDIQEYYLGGPTTGTANAATPDGGETDSDGYLTMGETWSVGAIAPLSATAPARATHSAEWVYWVGSGYSNSNSEGKSIYMIDLKDGDILYRADVGSRTGTTTINNVVVANVAAYIPTKVECADPAPNPADGVAEAAVVGDTHGRLWKITAASPATATLMHDLGANHPVAVAASVLKINSDSTSAKMHVYAHSGGDDRITPPPANTPPFKMVAIREDNSTTFTQLTGFPVNFREKFRGTAQPLVAIGCNATTLSESFVFFVGTQFNPAGGTNCVSSFDTIVYALKASRGDQAAFDLSSSTTVADDQYAILRGEKVQNITARDGRVVLDRGLAAENVPGALAPPASQNPNALPAVVTTGIRWGSPLCF